MTLTDKEIDKAIEIVGKKDYGYPENEIAEAFELAIEALNRMKGDNGCQLK